MMWVDMILKFIVDIVHYVAWPVVILLLLLVFKDAILAKLGQMKLFEHKDTKVLFELSRLQQKSLLTTADIMAVTKETCNYERYLDLIEILGLTSCIVVIEMRKRLEYKPFYDFYKNTLESVTEKLRKERPTSTNILMFDSLIKSSADDKNDQKQ